jgi:hypothetical protein
VIEEMKPVAYDEAVLYAARALFDGVANDGQQKRFMEWLLLNLCEIGQDDMHPNDRWHAYRSGRRSVGIQVAKLRTAEALALIKPAASKLKRGKRQPNE